MDEIDRLMNNLGVPAQLRNKLRKQLVHSLEEFGRAQLAVQQGNPMSASLVPVPPGAQFPNPGGPQEAMMMEEVSEDEDDSPEPTLTECYLHDLVALRETITLHNMLKEGGTAYETQTLVPILETLRGLLARNMSSRSEDAIAMIQLDEHDRKDMQARARYGRWQRAVAEGRTRKGFRAWLSDYEQQDDGSEEEPLDQETPGE